MVLGPPSHPLVEYRDPHPWAPVGTAGCTRTHTMAGLGEQCTHPTAGPDPAPGGAVLGVLGWG